MAGTESDWAAQTAGTIDRVIGSVRGKTSEPIERLTRILVYGLVAAIVGVTGLILTVILVIRVLDVLLPSGIWSVDLILGGILTLAGLLIWRVKAVPRRS